MSRWVNGLMRFFAFTLLLIYPSTIFALSITDLHKEYLYGNYYDVIRIAAKLPESDATLYCQGLSYIKIADYPKARLSFYKLLRRFSDSGLVTQARLKIADTYFFEKNYPKAKTLYHEAKDSSVSDVFMPAVLLRLAQIASRQGDWEEKSRYVTNLKSKYPNSCEMKFVKILEDLGDFFTIQVGAFSVKKNALALAEKLRDEYSPYIVNDKTRNYLLYKVRVGRFKDRYDAEKTAAKLLNAGYPARIYP